MNLGIKESQFVNFIMQTKVCVMYMKLQMCISYTIGIMTGFAQALIDLLLLWDHTNSSIFIDCFKKLTSVIFQRKEGRSSCSKGSEGGDEGRSTGQRFAAAWGLECQPCGSLLREAYQNFA